MNKEVLPLTDWIAGPMNMDPAGVGGYFRLFILSRSANWFLLHLEIRSVRLTAQLDC